MHVRRTLIPLVGSENDQLGLDLGLGLATGMSAHADVLFVRPDPQDAIPYFGLGGDGLENIREDYRRYTEQTGKARSSKETTKR